MAARSSSSEPSRPGAARHCMVVHAHYPARETRVQRQALALIDAGHPVDVICLRDDDEPPRSVVDGVRVFRLPVRRHKGRGLAIQLLEYIAFFVLSAAMVSRLHLRDRYASVQVHNLPDFLVFAAAVPKATGAPVLLDLHDLMPEFFAARSDVEMQHPLVRFIRWQERISCGFADHVITVTESWKQSLVERGVDPAKISVVMNVPDGSIFRREPPDEAALEGDGLRLFYHGTFTWRYGLDLLLDAVAAIRTSAPDVRLTMLGSGETTEDLFEQRRQLDLEEPVTILTTPVDVLQLIEMIRRADIGVVPNRNDVFTDGILPTKLMEYVALGVPVIAARTTAIASYFDADMVEYFAPGDAAGLADAIIALRSDPDRRRQLAENADAFNRAYDPAATAAAYVAAVENARSAGGRVARGGSSEWDHADRHASTRQMKRSHRA